MKLYKKIIILLIAAFASFGFSCDMSDTDSIYSVDITGYGDNFEYIYYLDTDTSSDFTEGFGASAGSTSWYVLTLEPEFSSNISLYVSGVSSSCSTLYLDFYINGELQESLEDSVSDDTIDVASVHLSYDVSGSSGDTE